jgi:Ca-activated chloride channel family protein
MAKMIRHTPALLLVAWLTLQSEPICVTIVDPEPGEPVFGKVEVVVETSGEEPVTRVELQVDGGPAATISDPPYRFRVDVGEENRQHSFKAVAVGASGTRSEAIRVTPYIQINDQVQVALQQLYVTATHQGQPVHDLRRDELIIYDEGRRQELVTFARGDIPFTAVLLVDASTSMTGDKQAHALRGAQVFANRMQPLDEARLIAFADHIRAASPFTSFAEVLTTSLGQVPAAGGTAINDVLYLSLSQLEMRQGRRVIVLLSDGVDTHSAMHMRHVRPCARRSRAIVYFIRTRAGELSELEPGEVPSVYSPWRDQRGHRQEFKQLLRVVEESGGRLLEVGSPEKIESAFGDIITELRDHYVLGYYPSNRKGDGSWHKVRVKVTRPGVGVRTSAGYIDLG